MYRRATRRRATTFVCVVLMLLGLSGLATAAVSVDPVTRSVTTPAFQIDFSDANPEELSSLRWRGSAEMTTADKADCVGNLHYFGNSWAHPDSGSFKSLVGWGQAGTWSTGALGRVSIDSASLSSNGCFGSEDIPVHTEYRFWDSGPYVDRFKVIRTFDFSTPFNNDFRPFIPRLFDTFGIVLHPDSTGSMVIEASGDCGFGCRVTDWDGSWFAMQSGVGSGVIVRQSIVGASMDLWVDYDGGIDFQGTNATAALAIAPPGGFTGSLRVETLLCFYDADSWVPSINLPAGCVDSFDDDDNSSFESNIEWLVAQRITQGCAVGVYCPTKPVTRGEMAVFLDRWLNLPDQPGSNTFSDDNGHFAEASIEAIVAAGITQGIGDGKFGPDQSVTRGQMALFLSRALDLPAQPGVDSFTDDDGHFAEAAIESLVAAGITQGLGGGLFGPNQPVTREQMAAFLYRGDQWMVANP